MDLDGMFFENDDFELINKIIGKGTFGTVYIIKNRKENKKYAAKILTVDPNKGLTGHSQMLFLRESSILHKLHHAAIVGFIGINFQSFFGPKILEPTILTEYLPNGSLKVILNKLRRSISVREWTPTKKYICLLGITSAMKYLHANQIIHRDLKPENILIDDDYYPRICDFGLSRFYSNLFNMSMSGFVGTPLYMAPELFDDDCHYGPEVDVYSFAILAYEIVSGEVPYSELGKNVGIMKLQNHVCKGARPKFNKDFQPKIRDLITQCWSQDPKTRPSFKQVFSRIASDFSILGEEVDEDEVNQYLIKINEIDCLKKTHSQFELLKKAIPQLEHGEYLLLAACKIENIELVKYVLSLKTIDVNLIAVYYFYYFNSVYM